MSFLSKNLKNDISFVVKKYSNCISFKLDMEIVTRDVVTKGLKQDEKHWHDHPSSFPRHKLCLAFYLSLPPPFRWRLSGSSNTLFRVTLAKCVLRQQYFNEIFNQTFQPFGWRARLPPFRQCPYAHVLNPENGIEKDFFQSFSLKTLPGGLGLRMEEEKGEGGSTRRRMLVLCMNSKQLTWWDFLKREVKNCRDRWYQISCLSFWFYLPVVLWSLTIFDEKVITFKTLKQNVWWIDLFEIFTTRTLRHVFV